MSAPHRKKGRHKCPTHPWLVELKLHCVAALAEERWHIQIRLLEVRDHGAAHAIHCNDVAEADESANGCDATNDGPEDCSRDVTRGSSCDSITMRGDPEPSRSRRFRS